MLAGLILIGPFETVTFVGSAKPSDCVMQNKTNTTRRAATTVNTFLFIRILYLFGRKIVAQGSLLFQTGICYDIQ